MFPFSKGHQKTSDTPWWRAKEVGLQAGQEALDGRGPLLGQREVACGSAAEDGDSNDVDA